jgi:hypothetical protein
MADKVLVWLYPIGMLILNTVLLPVYAFTFIGGIFADKVLGLKSPFLLRHDSGNLIIAFSPLHFFHLGITLQLLEQALQAKYLQWLRFYGQS